jgi:hypothetical protein
MDFQVTPPSITARPWVVLIRRQRAKKLAIDEPVASDVIGRNFCIGLTIDGEFPPPLPRLQSLARQSAAGAAPRNSAVVAPQVAPCQPVTHASTIWSAPPKVR